MSASAEELAAEQHAAADGENPSSGDLWQVPVSRFEGAEFTRAIHAVMCPRGITTEQLLDEKCWAHIADRLRVPDRIEVMPDDFSFFATFVVLATGKNYAQVEMISFVELSKPSPRAISSDFRVHWAGGHDKFCVLRGDEKIRVGFATEREGERWIRSHLEAEKH